MGTREDDDYGQVDRDYWNKKYDHAPECEVHGDTQYFNSEVDEWECYNCIEDDEIARTYHHG